MELNPQLHPVGTKFIGHRWQYHIREVRDDLPRVNRSDTFATESRPERRFGENVGNPWCDVFDPDLLPAPMFTRAPGEQLLSMDVMEYSESGTFVRLRELGTRNGNSTGTILVDPASSRSNDYGDWYRTRRLEILELLENPHDA